MIHAAIPLSRYHYVRVDPTSNPPVSPDGFRPDLLSFDITGTSSTVGSIVHATFMLHPKSSKASMPTLGSTSLTHVRVFVSAPNCDYRSMDVFPAEFGYDTQVVDQTALWTQPRARFDKDYEFTVDLKLRAPGTMRVIFGLQAAELIRPVLHTFDLVVT